jgi:ketosteroid isomerase-like protein
VSGSGEPAAGGTPAETPLSDAEGQRLAEEWVDAWNSHDLDAIMSLYAPDVRFQTPTVIDTLGIADGVVQGRERLREHFARGLERLPGLRFELERVYTGVAALAIVYRWADGTPVCEVHEYDPQLLIARVQALYSGLAW